MKYSVCWYRYSSFFFLLRLFLPFHSIVLFNNEEPYQSLVRTRGDLSSCILWNFIIENFNNTIQYNTMQCNASQCKAMWYDVMRCDVPWCGVMWWRVERQWRKHDILMMTFWINETRQRMENENYILYSMDLKKTRSLIN